MSSTVTQVALILQKSNFSLPYWKKPKKCALSHPHMHRHTLWNLFWQLPIIFNQRRQAS